MDQRVKNLARTVVRYSVKAKKGELIAIESTSVAEPLIEAVYEELLQAGAYPLVQMKPSSLTESFFTHGKALHFDQLHPVQKTLANQMDGTIRIASSANTRDLSAINPKRQARYAKTMHPVKNIILKKKWVITLFPTPAYAQDAEMSLRDFEDFVYRATFADQENPIREWKALGRRQETLIRKLRNADTIRIVGSDTDLTLSVKGRPFVNSPGTHNMPSGEIFTSPVETSTEGYIRYDYPVCVNGREIDGIRLVFRNGEVVEASATKNQDYLLTMLDMDKGARRLGELGIGCNYGIQKFIKNILFDEKIGGTIHLAVGQSFEEAKGKNKSSLHWDMIKDLRKGGAMYVDGKVFQKDGKFV